MNHPLRFILLIEDDPDIQEVAKMSLEEVGGFDVTACGSGREALDIVSRVRPDLLIIDFMMPGMDGGETLAALRARPDMSRIPAIFMTAKVRPDEVSRMRAMGAADVIPKPFDPITLPDKVNAIWARIHA
jgi:two-component system, OmpR family, response regulator